MWSLRPWPIDFWPVSQSAFVTVSHGVVGYHCSASQELWQFGLNKKRLNLIWHTDKLSYLYFWYKPMSSFFFSIFFHFQLSTCCMEGSTVLCAKTTFMTKTWNKSPKTSRERHGNYKVWWPNHALCIIAPSHMHCNGAFTRILSEAGICVTPNVHIVLSLILLTRQAKHQVILMAELSRTKRSMLIWTRSVKNKTSMCFKSTLWGVLQMVLHSNS